MIISKQLDAEITENVYRSRELVAKIEPILAHQGPEVLGAVLVDLTSTWLARHHPALRAATLNEFMVTLIKLVVVNEKIIFGDGGFPTEGLH